MFVCECIAVSRVTRCLKVGTYLPSKGPTYLLTSVISGSPYDETEQLSRLTALKLGTGGQDFDDFIRSVGEGLQKVPEGDFKNSFVQANARFIEGGMEVLPAFLTSPKSHFRGAAQGVRLT